jgi:hypothetical protein
MGCGSIEVIRPTKSNTFTNTYLKPLKDKMNDHKHIKWDGRNISTKVIIFIEFSKVILTFLENSLHIKQMIDVMIHNNVTPINKINLLMSKIESLYIHLHKLL